MSVKKPPTPVKLASKILCPSAVLLPPLEAETSAVIAKFTKELIAILPGMLVPQDVLAAVHSCRNLEAAGDGAFKVFRSVVPKETAKFAPGTMAVSWKDTGNRKVAWKQVAVRLAKELAELRGEPFNEKLFEATEQASVDKSESWLPDIVVSQ